MTKPRRPHVTGPDDGESAEPFPGFGVRLVIPGDVAADDLALVEMRIDARRLIPPHRHVSEDEVSYVIEGEVGFRVGDEEITASPGTAVYKPRGVFHAFWNATDQPARVLEIIVPAGLERSFFGRPSPRPREPNVHSDEWVPELRERYGLRPIGE